MGCWPDRWPVTQSRFDIRTIPMQSFVGFLSRFQRACVIKPRCERGAVGVCMCRVSADYSCTSLSRSAYRVFSTAHVHPLVCCWLSVGLKRLLWFGGSSSFGLQLLDLLGDLSVLPDSISIANSSGTHARSLVTWAFRSVTCFSINMTRVCSAWTPRS